ncbi:MAG: hypothetical protein WD379_08530 [Dehalococcoidia bacterium]
MHWRDFEKQAPELAAFGRERIDATGLVLVGTLRRDGLPRISPVEPLIVDDQLQLGMMHRSFKALDLLRDPRCLVQTTVRDREDLGGELKFRGLAAVIGDAGAIERYCQALFEKINWRPGGQFHLFALDIEEATFLRYLDNGDQVVKSWRPGGPVEERVRHWAGGGLSD